MEVHSTYPSTYQGQPSQFHLHATKPSQAMTDSPYVKTKYKYEERESAREKTL